MHVETATILRRLERAKPNAAYENLIQLAVETFAFEQRQPLATCYLSFAILVHGNVGGTEPVELLSWHRRVHLQR